MTSSSEKFKVSEIGRKIKGAYLALDKLLSSMDNEQTRELKEILAEGVKEYNKHGSLSIAFIGQYSAGKSTIISALSGRRDIYINADIATDKTAAYGWNGVRLIDTPGLFTEREDHDEITYRAIERSDLLVFCLTYMLFDSITISNFKKLAYDKGYAWKMMIVVNKMSDEAGEEGQKIINYTKSLSDALSPHDINDFRVCFIDAKDYCEGVDEKDDWLQDVSRFNTFTSALNSFVEENGSYSKLDTPIRILLSIVDRTEQLLEPNDAPNAIFLEILRRLSRKVDQERERLRTKVKGIQLESKSSILAEADNLVQYIGSQEFRENHELAEIKVRECRERTEERLQKAFEEALESIRIEIENELKKDLPQAVIVQLQASYEANAEDIRNDQTTSLLRNSVAGLQKIADKAGVDSLIKSATRGGLLKTSSDGHFLRAMDVAGSKLHGTVKVVGKAVGYKFKPFEAVHIAKNIGNAAKFVGPAMALVGVVAEGYSMYSENKKSQEIINLRRDIQNQFQKVANNISYEIDQQMFEFGNEVYDDIQMVISKEREQQSSKELNRNKDLGYLTSIRKVLDSALADVKSLTKSTN